ncbi:MAG: glycosyltransferase family 4 protein [Actinomycetota bacterium]|nr:glycosyltransferase family 4 protein [Actinomycetota bacterium]
MRIGLIAPPWVPVPPPGYGGIEMMLDLLARGLVDAGHDLLLFATGDSTCPVPRGWLFADTAGLDIGTASQELRHVIHAYEALRGYDIVHDHSLVGPFYAERFGDLPVVTTNHGPFNEDLNDLYRVMSSSVPVIAISHTQARQATGVPIARVIHHGVDADAFPFGDGDGGYLMSLGRMASEKGAHRAAEVARKAGARLLLAGKMEEPAEFDYFEQTVQPLMSEDIEYIGQVDEDHKLELLAGARALINPIRWSEPFGLVMVEALACGTPVLAFKEGAATEIVTHGVTGFLCDDEDDMAARVDQLHRVDRRTCRAAVEDYFSARRMVAEHVEFYEQVLRTSARSR